MQIVCLHYVEIKCYIISIEHQNQVLGAANSWYDTYILACMVKNDVSNVGAFNPVLV